MVRRNKGIERTKRLARCTQQWQVPAHSTAAFRFFLGITASGFEMAFKGQMARRASRYKAMRMTSTFLGMRSIKKLRTWNSTDDLICFLISYFSFFLFYCCSDRKV